jgi:hypothetical protein
MEFLFAGISPEESLQTTSFLLCCYPADPDSKNSVTETAVSGVPKTSFSAAWNLTGDC